MSWWITQTHKRMTGKDVLYVTCNNHFYSYGYSTVGATAVSMWWSLTKLDTTSYTQSLCLNAFVRTIRELSSEVGTEDLQRSLRGLQQNEGSLTTLLSNSPIINPVRGGVWMNNITVGCTLATIISLYTAWALLQFSTKSAARNLPLRGLWWSNQMRHFGPNVYPSVT